MEEANITYTGVCTLVAIPALGFFVKKWISDMQEQAKERSADLKEDIKALRDCMTGIKKDVEHKVDRSECEKRSDDKWKRIYGHYHDGDGNVVART